MRISLPPRGLVTLIVAVSLLGGPGAACGNAEAATGPPEINYGRDVCVECSMVISEARFAAAYRLEDGTEKKFDDIGGMLKHGQETGEVAGAVAWVHDFSTEEWVEAAAAFYVPTLSVATPMAHGIVAFSDHQRATEFAIGVGGEVIDWETVLLLPIIDGLVGNHHSDEDGGTVSDDEMDDNDSNQEEMDHEMEGDM